MGATTIRVGLLGCGVVGGSLVGLLAARGDDIEARTGLRFQIGPVAVRDLDKERPVELDASQLTTDPTAVVDDPEVDVVVELMGGVEPARSLVAKALANGKPVITANKALLAAVGSELFAIADSAGVDLLFEAAVAGGIPFIRPLRESLAGEHISRVMGIVNGTTNYILTKMSEEGADYAEALAEAQALGYAEADPTADVDGHDAAAKAAIIGSIAYGSRITIDDVYVEGISGITPDDIHQAAKLGYVIKLLAIVESHGVDGIAARVHPTMVPDTHPLASVRESFNAVFVEGAAVGDLMFYGRGAGGGPTASAVLGDLIDAAGNLIKGTHATITTHDPAPILPIDFLRCEYYLNLDLHDRPGALAAVAGIFGRRGVSIRAMEQIATGEEGPEGEARVLFITHTAREADLRATLDDLREQADVGKVNSVLRVLSP
ncbi:MAG TPA: homoserine dehydrogenase [Acidimicrobiales bacterium]|nr:homoserine dehydrogenase [Acidimicrobiales bacterium]